MDLKEIVLEGVDWIDVAEHKGKWQPLVNKYWNAVCNSLTQHKLYIFISSNGLQVHYMFQFETIIMYTNNKIHEEDM